MRSNGEQKRRENDMIRLLGRQTSGNVQKVIFCLEELGVRYIREDYGRQFANTLTDEYRASLIRMRRCQPSSTVIW
jgi:hypothetical protein